MRKHIVAGNWKMNKTLDESKALASELVALVKKEVNTDTEIVACPTMVNLAGVSDALKGSPVHAGAQNCHQEESGAFTGECSAAMVKATGATHVILGHSERREFFKETNEELAQKVKMALKEGLTPIFCCGETLDQREAGIHFDHVKKQLTESLFSLSEADFKKVVIAYEPIWAIGTGKTASSDQAQEMHSVLRKHIEGKYGAQVADDTSLLYGGSCKPGNAKELFACPDVDGGLIGGASLKARDFVDIILSF